VSFSGEAVSDRVLCQVGLVSGPLLTRCRLANASQVTDTGVSGLLSQVVRLESLEVADLGRSVSGARGRACAG